MRRRRGAAAQGPERLHRSDHAAPQGRRRAPGGRALGLPNWDKPSFACLSSRFQYGDTITPDKLRQVDRAEAFLRELGFRPGNFPQAERYYAEAISLPMYSSLTEAQQDEVVAALRRALT